jgi:N-acetylglucosamine-6-phosphate deacetylase
VRLGCGAALVAGEVVPGDISVDRSTGCVQAVGLSPAGTGTVIPGLVDLQVNGVGAVDLRIADRAGYELAGLQLASHGVTAAQPTFHSQSLDGYHRSLEALAAVSGAGTPGCRFLPAHLEGPFLSVPWAGAHDPEFLFDPTPAAVDDLLSAGPVGFVTLAPELRGGLEAIARLRRRGVTVSIGHSDADAATVGQAADAGARHLTHCWNAHRRVSARDPGPLGAAIADPRWTVGLIGDLHHVAPELVLLTMRAAAGRVAVTSDMVALSSFVTVGGVARRADGTLVGGLAAPDECLRNLVGLGIGLAPAVDACGGVQRRLLGLPEVLLRVGDPADLVVVDDDLHPVRTLVGGHEVWRH